MVSTLLTLTLTRVADKTRLVVPQP